MFNCIPDAQTSQFTLTLNYTRWFLDRLLGVLRSALAYRRSRHHRLANLPGFCIFSSWLIRIILPASLSILFRWIEPSLQVLSIQNFRLYISGSFPQSVKVFFFFLRCPTPIWTTKLCAGVLDFFLWGQWIIVEAGQSSKFFWWLLLGHQDFRNQRVKQPFTGFLSQ